jgi:hypothetical protein
MAGIQVKRQGVVCWSREGGRLSPKSIFVQRIGKSPRCGFPIAEDLAQAEATAQRWVEAEAHETSPQPVAGSSERLGDAQVAVPLNRPDVGAQHGSALQSSSRLPLKV